MNILLYKRLKVGSKVSDRSHHRAGATSSRRETNMNPLHKERTPFPTCFQDLSQTIKTGSNEVPYILIKM